MDFVYAASILRAQQYKLKPVTDRARVVEIASAYKVIPFVPRSGVKIAVTDAEAESQNNTNMDVDGRIVYMKTFMWQHCCLEDTDTILHNLNISLAKLNLNEGSMLNTIDFEKDDDTNHHVEFIAAASNLRANNYDIEMADQIKVPIDVLSYKRFVTKFLKF